MMRPSNAPTQCDRAMRRAMPRTDGRTNGLTEKTKTTATTSDLLTRTRA
jgi:hypothetical protein